MNIYVASSWRNALQPAVVKALRGQGHDVYDFRNPHEGHNGFHWSEIDPDWQNWDAKTYREKLASHPIARDGFLEDFDAMRRAEAFVLVMPCGRSAHLELGWATGAAKKHTCILLADGEPELMYRLVDKLALSIDEVIDWLDSVNDGSFVATGGGENDDKAS